MCITMWIMWISTKNAENMQNWKVEEYVDKKETARRNILLSVYSF